jgi:phosphatidylethanolamine/phosphatidyl-N-methylethanolamine N-methyltransferase
LLLGCLQLGAGGAPFVQFTYFYNPQFPVSGGAIAIEVSPMLWRNLWPARVWCYRLRGA